MLVQAGNFFFPGKIPQKDLSPFSLEADDDDSVPLPSAPKDGTVQGKPRNFLPFAPSWAKHPDYDRVSFLQGHFPCQHSLTELSFLLLKTIPSFLLLKTFLMIAVSPMI